MPKILLVDDVKFFLELERSFLDREGLEVLVADNGPAAIELARRERPQMVVLDLNMPGMDGDEVCRVIKADPALAATPVIMVTSGQREAEVRRCTGAGCDGFLRKPLTRDGLLEMIGRFLKAQARAAPRVPVRVPVALAPIDGPPGAPLEGQTVDVSVGGVYVETVDPPPAGARLAAEFTLPGFTVPVVARAVVVWVNRSPEKVKEGVPAGMGLRFVDIAPGAKGVLELFVSRALAAREGKA
jgi:uncharacterized protein (TIGR02266 family)